MRPPAPATHPPSPNPTRLCRGGLPRSLPTPAAPITATATTTTTAHTCAHRTPSPEHVFNALPPESRTGRVQLLVPARLREFSPLHPQQQHAGASAGAGAPAGTGQPQQQQQQHPVPAFAASAPACVVHLAATGDQTFSRRLRLGFPLLSDVSAVRTRRRRVQHRGAPLGLGFRV